MKSYLDLKIKVLTCATKWIKPEDNLWSKPVTKEQTLCDYSTLWGDCSQIHRVENRAVFPGVQRWGNRVVILQGSPAWADERLVGLDAWGWPSSHHRANVLGDTGLRAWKWLKDKVYVVYFNTVKRFIRMIIGFYRKYKFNLLNIYYKLIFKTMRNSFLGLFFSQQSLSMKSWLYHADQAGFEFAEI